MTNVEKAVRAGVRSFGFVINSSFVLRHFFHIRHLKDARHGTPT